MTLLLNYSEKINALCEKYNVRTLFAFGSVTNAGFRDNSDVDLVVDIENNDPIAYSDDYFSLKFQLEQLLNRHIDLLEQKALKNPYLKQTIEKTKVLVYGKRS